MPDLIDRYMTQRGVTQTWLADEVGVKQQSVSAWLHGTSPTLQNLARIVHALDIPPSEVVTVLLETIGFDTQPMAATIARIDAATERAERALAAREATAAEDRGRRAQAARRSPRAGKAGR